MLTLPSFFSEKNSVASFLSYLGPLESRGLLTVSFDKTSTIWQIFQAFLESYLKASPFYDTHALFLEYQERNKNNPAKTTPLFVKKVKRPSDLQVFKTHLQAWQKIGASLYATEKMPSKVAEGLILAQNTFKDIDDQAYTRHGHLFYILDVNNQMQAYAKFVAYADNRCGISEIVSSPTNNDEMNTKIRVSGAASALIEQLIFMVLQTNSTTPFINAFPDDRALGFYLRLNFFKHPFIAILEGENVCKFLKEFGGRAHLHEET